MSSEDTAYYFTKDMIESGKSLEEIFKIIKEQFIEIHREIAREAENYKCVI